MENRKFEIYQETSHNPGVVIEFYDAKQLFYDHSTFNIFTLPQFALLLDMCVKIYLTKLYMFFI